MDLEAPASGLFTFTLIERSLGLGQFGKSRIYGTFRKNSTSGISELHFAKRNVCRFGNLETFNDHEDRLSVGKLFILTIGVPFLENVP